MGISFTHCLNRPSLYLCLHNAMYSCTCICAFYKTYAVAMSVCLLYGRKFEPYNVGFVPHSLCVYWFPRYAISKFHKLGSLNNKLYYLTVLENPKI
jgi:hypothetical protein